MERLAKCVLGLCVGVLFSAERVLAAPLPFKSKEEIEFLSKSEQKLLDLLKTDDFQGILQRPFEKKGDLQTADLYQFRGITKSKMDRALCQDFLAKIFGPLNKISLSVKSVEIFSTAMGPACEARVMDDKDPQAKFPERRAVLGFVSGKPTALILRLSKKTEEASVQENVRLFWQGLR